MTDPLRRNSDLVDSLGSALREGEHGLTAVPMLLRRVLEEEGWREFRTKRGDLVRHDRFERFVETPPLKGLGASVELIRRIVADKDHWDVLDMVDRALQRPNGTNQHGKVVDNVNTLRPDGNGRTQALRRLRKDRPDLHERVLAGELSPHGAMVQAGFRKRTATVPVHDPIATARALRRQFGREAIVELIAALLDPDGGDE